MKIDETSVILPIPSNERISWFEKTYRVELPIEYKGFLKNYNGAKPITNILKSNGREYVVERFLCLLDKPKENEIYGWYDLTSVLTQLDYRKNVNPCITIWNHEESDWILRRRSWA